MTPYRHPHLRNVFYSPLFRDFCEENNCRWFLEEVASGQLSKEICAERQRNERFNDMQIWRLRSLGDNVAVIEAADDFPTRRLAYRKKIEHTDWDFKKELKVYAGLTQVGDEIGIYIFLPSEY